MKKIITSVALATVAIAATAGSARADLNISGAVGLPLNPTAQIPGAEGARLQANYYDLGDSASYYGLFGATRVGENSKSTAALTSSIPTPMRSTAPVSRLAPNI